MEGLGTGLRIMMTLDMTDDGEENPLENEGSEEFDFLLFPFSFSHLTDDKGLFT
jgi:hypothetical protein